LKIQFDLKAFIYLLVFSALLSGLYLFLGADRFEQYLLPVALIFLGLFIGFSMFQIPICMRFGWYARGEGMILGALDRIGDSPAVIPLLFNLFVFQFQQGKIDAARATLDRISGEGPSPEAIPVLALNRAGLYAAREEYKKALDIYSRFTVEDFSEKVQPIFLNNLAFAYFGLGIELELGIELADRAFNMSSDPRFSRTLAGLLFKTGSLDASRAWCEYGIRRLRRADRISRAWCYYILALVKRELGDSAASVNAARKGKAICPVSALNDRLDELIG